MWRYEQDFPESVSSTNVVLGVVFIALVFYWHEAYSDWRYGNGNVKLIDFVAQSAVYAGAFILWYFALITVN